MMEAVSLASDAVVAAIWPPERLRQRARWFVSPGHTIAGLAEYEDDELGPSAD
jgi:hypothetical protein